MREASATARRLEPALPPGFAALYAEHYDFLWRCALRMGTPAADLEDVVQECFIVALRRFDDFDPQGRGRPSTWLFGILRNVQRNHARAARRRAARLELLARTNPIEVRPSAEAGLVARLIDEFLATLDEDKRAAFVLAEIEGMTGPELAEALELNLNTANSRVRAARRAFVQFFAEQEPRSIVRTEVERLASERAPAVARQRGLPILATVTVSKPAIGGMLGVLGTKAIAGLIFGAALVVAATMVAGARPSEATVPDPLASPKSVASPVSAAVSDRPPPLEPDRAIEPEPEPEPRRSKPREPKPLERLADARTALLEGDPGKALALVEGRRFPAALEGRRIAAEIAALCRLDRRADAEVRARRWRAAHIDDPTAAELIGVCWSE